ncbi:PAS domain S-box protein [Spirulina subsalsa FACHB-351]|uniref:PAS domain S-box protein n=1 Tax=Spirulina subsalsa FACHB-351 TaxID=234711 RepID=A0ABT3L6X7_9CYAN|nr:adenylate/guanylate cyclase domain-containing protein [Spirulina subsalsa]MCW6037259.1 PAS domain S-box protein [Spirulina subsalsa FACHB-351]
MANDSTSPEALRAEIEQLRQENARLCQEKLDLEIVLENTVSHADFIESQLQRTNEQLAQEVKERQRALAALETVLSVVKQDMRDLTILLANTTEHGDLMESLLYQQAEDVTRESEQRLAQFLEAIPVGVMVFDGVGNLYYMNRKAADLLGKSHFPDLTLEKMSEVCQLYVLDKPDLYPTQDLVAVKALGGQSTKADNLEIQRDAVRIPIECWGTPIFDEEGKVIYALTAFQDITDRKNAEEVRVKLTNDLLELTQAYSRFVPKQFIHLLSKKSIIDIEIGDRIQKKMSVLFADIRDFTKLSEGMTPQENFLFLNSYLQEMDPLILDHHGFVDKYMGDGIMALFPRSPDDAITASIYMLRALKQWNQQHQNSNFPPLKIGIAINTGDLMLGIVGGKNRMDGTVISDTVNLTFRIERLTQLYGVSLLISQHTFSQLKYLANYDLRIIDRVQVKGRVQPITIYEVFNSDPPSLRTQKRLTKTLFEQGITKYHLGHLDEAIALFEQCQVENPEDPVIAIYLERCRNLDG